MPPAKRRRVTIQDVAELAGVSKGAVSRSFNGAERLPASTVQRIHDAAEQLGWRPNAAARAIKGAPAHTIGFVLQRDPDLLGIDPFFPLFLAGVERVLSDNAYSITIRFVADEAQEARCYRDWVAEGRVDAFIVSDLRDDDPRFALLDDLGGTAVVIGEPPADVHRPAVFHTSDDCIDEVVEGWVARGHTRIGHVMGDPALQHGRRRRDVWARALERHGLPTDALAVGGFTEAGAVEATRALLTAAEPPTAIFYANDVMAAAGMRVMSELQLAAGTDVAVAGFDGIPLGTYLSPQLATIDCDYVELGALAGQILLAELAGRPTDPERCELPARFLARASYGTDVAAVR
ncbi:LacI family DNA-binding transcriptional regulator [Cellulomonas wangsupingiae]|uniref:LacI family transcriptional regulator n=1 Tax=Cellulomonas wangsupingiae TaxID=2968085 RepID=A0ABY5K337_9CELL|nr:LacI family DNA-binding transcriptional regulator [Cellulomonas wangsupingiae]MCC2336655.1 LacI family transcriptional regulator [Cellulomonas wangsupingiae]MCM0640504.1 LacI family transcriptional regulator [Cellulomonas wangsupingiae]UUI64468.1 LacI family transcriptional regulator [Cellulomonas wangsupingiae]